MPAMNTIDAGSDQSLSGPAFGAHFGRWFATHLVVDVTKARIPIVVPLSADSCLMTGVSTGSIKQVWMGISGRAVGSLWVQADGINHRSLRDRPRGQSQQGPSGSDGSPPGTSDSPSDRGG